MPQFENSFSTPNEIGYSFEMGNNETDQDDEDYKIYEKYGIGLELFKNSSVLVSFNFYNC